jgi:superfamily II DNA or RNA helicase
MPDSPTPARPLRHCLRDNRAVFGSSYFHQRGKTIHKAPVRTRCVGADVFRDLSPDALSSIDAWIKVKPISVVKAKPDPSYQVQASADIKAAFIKYDRATAVMASGTGKMLVAP